ncbi:MAG: calcium/proton exchanger [Thermoleophilaceae bacterium]
MRLRPVYYLSAFIPLAILLDALHASSALIFFAAAIAVIPTAALMGEATEQLAARSGPGIGGLLNVTFGNAPELIIAFFALIEGLQEVVKASLVGSIISNILLVLGASMFVGGLGRESQQFNRITARAQAAMLLLALTALILPAIFQLVHGGHLPGVNQERQDFGSDLDKLSFGVAIVLIASYAAGLVFSLVTHRELFNPYSEREHDTEGIWSTRRSVSLLAVAGLAVGGMSEILVHSIEKTSKDIGLSPFFIGVIVVAIVGNAAEHWVAVVVARKDKMNLAMNIAVGSSAQVALFVAPVLVLLSFVFGPHAMALVFNGYEIAAMLFAVLIAGFVTADGESNWFEGVQLLGVYVVLGLVFAFA